MRSRTGTWVHEVHGAPVEIAWTRTERGLIRLNCLAYVHRYGKEEGHQEELEDLIPCWHTRMDIKDRIGMSLEGDNE